MLKLNLFLKNSFVFLGLILYKNHKNSLEKLFDYISQVLTSVYHHCREKFEAKINAKFSQLSWYYVAKKCNKKRDIAFFLHLL